MRLCASVFSMRLCVCFFYNLQSPRTSSMTERKYSHTVFYPKMASASSGTNIMCLKTYIWGNGTKKSLLRGQIMLQFFLHLLDQGAKIFSDVSTCIFPLHIQYFIWPWPPLMTSEPAQGGSLLIKRPHMNTNGSLAIVPSISS